MRVLCLECAAGLLLLGGRAAAANNGGTGPNDDELAEVAVWTDLEACLPACLPVYLSACLSASQPRQRCGHATRTVRYSTCSNAH